MQELRPLETPPIDRSRNPLNVASTMQLLFFFLSAKRCREFGREFIRTVGGMGIGAAGRRLTKYSNLFVSFFRAKGTLIKAGSIPIASGKAGNEVN